MLMLVLVRASLATFAHACKGDRHQVRACRPLIHALVEPGLTRAIGIEVDAIKCMKSESVIHEACQKMRSLDLPVPSTPLVLHRDIEAVRFFFCCCFARLRAGTLRSWPHTD